MSVIRVKRTSRFTIVPNETLRDSRLSDAALGLLVRMLSYPDDWEFSLKHLAGQNQSRLAAVRSSFQKLEEAGYVSRKQARGAQGRLSGWEYEVSDRPSTDVRKPHDGESATAVRFPNVGEPHATKNETTKRAEKPNGFSALRQQAKSAARKQEPGRFSSGKVSPSETPPPNPARPPSPAPARKLSANQEFIKRAGETWNEVRHPSWPECDVRRPTKRAVKYLQALFASEDKDPERALETVRLGLRWIRSKDEWASGQVFTFEQMLANEKLETAASKARHALATVSSRVDATDSIGGPPASRSGRVSSIQVGRTYHRKGTSETVRVVEDLLGNGQVFQVEDPSTGETMKLSYYELHPIHNIASA
jgi:hypothetical protein